MLPNQGHLPEGLLQILRGRIWLLIVPFVVVGTGTAVLARRLPDLYESKAVLYVVPRQVSESIVRSAVATAMSDRLPTVMTRILVRPKLEPIVLEFKLYAEESKTELMDDIIDQMKRDITIQPLRTDTFSVAYRNRSNPRSE
jgi:hypothetical protein